MQILREAISSIKNGNKTRGRQLLIRVLENDENNETAWLWLTKCLSNNKQKSECFERVLEINPNNQHAKDGLKRLDTLSKVKEHPSKESNSPHSKKPQKEYRSSNKKIILILSVILFTLLCIILPLATVGSEKDENKVTVCYSGEDWADLARAATGYNIHFVPNPESPDWDMVWFEDYKERGFNSIFYNKNNDCITKAGVVSVYDSKNGDPEKAGNILGATMAYFNQSNWASEKVDECLLQDVEYIFTDKNGNDWYFECDYDPDEVTIVVLVDIGEKE